MHNEEKECEPSDLSSASDDKNSTYLSDSGESLNDDDNSVGDGLNNAA